MDSFHAIVLRSQPYRESSVLLTLLTARQGIVRALAKGVRRDGKKSGSATPAAALEPFAWIEGALALREPDALGTLGALSVREGWDYLRADPTRWAFAALGMEVLGGVAGVSAPDESLFNEGCLYLRLLERAAGAGSLTALLLMRLLHHAGFPPTLPEDWSAETATAAASPALAYDFGENTFLMPGTPAPPMAMRLPGAAIAAIAPLLAAPPDLAAEWTLPAALGPIVLRWLMRVWEDHLGRALVSARYLESMVLRAE